MYSIGDKRKFEMPGKIYYTGIIVSKESGQIEIETLRGENLTLRISDIVQSKRIGDVDEIN